MKNLSTRVAVVTGAANGIGKALAYGLAHEGCRIVLADLPGTELDNTAAAMARSGAECIPVGTDVSCSESVGLLARRTMDRFGEVHVLCNNAGVSLAGRPLIDLMPEDWNWLLGVNLLGAVHGLHHFLPILRDQDEAHVLNTASIGAFRGGTFNGPYCASKAALLSLSESLYRECVADGVPIGVTVLCPGAVHTTIADSDLRRTSKFPGTARPIDQRAAAGLRKVRAEGRSATHCAAVAIEAIKEDRFFAFDDRDAFLATADRDATAIAGRAPSR